jgi:hypothetical protein
MRYRSGSRCARSSRPSGDGLSSRGPGIWDSFILPSRLPSTWWNCHLHEFNIGGLRYGDPELLEEGGFPDDSHTFDERAVRLLDFDRGGGTTFSYLYDFGDYWRHAVEIEQPPALDVPPKLGACARAHGRVPPKMSAALVATSGSWPSWPTVTTRSTPI